LAFSINIQHMNPTKTFFPNLALFSHASSVGVTHEGVVPFALARCMGLARAYMSTWCHVDASHAGSPGLTELRRLLWHDWWPSRLSPRIHLSCQSGWCDWWKF
jgi:hypothetical protein